jgi:hypothetical protein
MKEIKGECNMQLAINKGLIYKSVAPLNGKWEEISAGLRKNLDVLEDIDKRAKKIEKNNILFRYFTESVADGRVFYQVTDFTTDKKGNYDKVYVSYCEGTCLDMYEHNYFGQGRWIDASYAIERIGVIDTIEKIRVMNGKSAAILLAKK